MGNVFKQNRVYEELKELIRSGERPAGFTFPPEVVLAQELGVARNTLRPALARLEEEGLVKRIKSIGTVVCGRKPVRDKYLLILNNSDGISDPYLYIMPYIFAAAEALNIGIEIVNRNFWESVSVKKGIENIAKAGVSGVIFLGNNLTGKENICTMLKLSGLPVLLPHAAVSDRSACPEFAMFQTDVPGSFRDALNYLHDSGYRRMAFIMKEDTPIEREHWIRGFSSAEYFRELERAGLSTDPVLFAVSPFSPEAIRSVTEHFLKLPQCPDVIFCYSDFFGMYVLQALSSIGIAVPDEIGVMGICGYPGSAYLSPPLTTVDYQYSRLGWKAVELMPELISRKKNGEPMPEIIMPHVLSIRNTTKTIIERKP